MLVKIGAQVYDSEKEPIMLILTPIDKQLIANMHREKMKYCSFPGVGFSADFIENFMKEPRYEGETD